MKPIIQKQFKDDEHNIRGDCLRACICSLLEISDKNVPNFVEYTNYTQKIYDFFTESNLKYRIHIDCDEPKHMDYYMAWGISPRGIRHSVIYSQGKLVHDPHPEGGDVKDIYAYAWLEKIE